MRGFFHLMKAAVCQLFYIQNVLNSDIHLCVVIQGGKNTLSYYHFENTRDIKTLLIFCHLSFGILCYNNLDLFLFKAVK